MPYVRIELTEGRSEDQKAAISAVVTRAVAEHDGAATAARGADGRPAIGPMAPA